jgi:hypothetical protein
MPELFAGFSRTELPVPASYPTSCSPQAWASAAPIQLLRTMLRLEPSLPERTIRLAPALPQRLVPLVLSNLPLDSARLTVEVTGDVTPRVSGLPDGVTVSSDPGLTTAHGGPTGG